MVVQLISPLILKGDWELYTQLFGSKCSKIRITQIFPCNHDQVCLLMAIAENKFTFSMSLFLGLIPFNKTPCICNKEYAVANNYSIAMQ